MEAMIRVLLLLLVTSNLCAQSERMYFPVWVVLDTFPPPDFQRVGWDMELEITGGLHPSVVDFEIMKNTGDVFSRHVWPIQANETLILKSSTFSLFRGVGYARFRVLPAAGFRGTEPAIIVEAEWWQTVDGRRPSMSSISAKPLIDANWRIFNYKNRDDGFGTTSLACVSEEPQTVDLQVHIPQAAPGAPVLDCSFPGGVFSRELFSFSPRFDTDGKQVFREDGTPAVKSAQWLGLLESAARCTKNTNGKARLISTNALACITLTAHADGSFTEGKIGIEAR